MKKKLLKNLTPPPLKLVSPLDMPEKLNLQLTVKSSPDELKTVREFVETAARQFGFSRLDIEKIVLATDEACSNIMRHGYDSEPTHAIDISIVTNGRKFTVTLDDNGKSYDLRAHPLPEMKDYFAEHRKGGLGIKIIQMVMDEVDYQTTPAKNRLILTKHLPDVAA